MSFFGMGPTEFLVIAVIAFVIFGPEKFTELAGTVGKFVREFRSMSGGITGEFQQAMNEFQQVGTEIKQVGGEIRQVTGEIQDSTRSLMQGNDPRTMIPRSINDVGRGPILCARFQHRRSATEQGGSAGRFRILCRGRACAGTASSACC